MNENQALAQEAVLTFPNVQNALRGEKALLDARLAVRIMSRPSALGEGCGICLRVDVGDYEAAREALAAAHVVIEAAYLKAQSGCGTGYSLIQGM